MIRSLFNGLSGLQGHQIQMDVIGSNIANINTVGYKKAQVTFEETLNLTMRIPDAPTDLRGGINPVQIGLGARVSSIKTNFTQGSVQETGNVTDLAIVGNGFFAVSDGARNYFTRAGNFHFDSDGVLVNNQGFKVQGKQADGNGKIAPDVVIDDISSSVFQQIPAHSTEKVSLAGNLDADEPILGTITRTRPLLATAQATDDMNGLYASGRAETFLELTSGLDTFTVGDQNSERTFIYGVDFTTLQQLATAITTAFAGRFSAAVGTNGQLVFTALANNVELKAFSNTSSRLGSAFQNVDGQLLLTANSTVSSDQMAHIATGTDTLVTLRDSQGDLLDLVAGDDLTLLSATIGEGTLPSTALLPNITATTTLEGLRNALQLALFGATPQPEEQVTLEADGRIKISGGLGTDRAVTGINIGAGVDPNQDTRQLFGASMSFIQDQEAKDVTHTATTTIFDDLGESHTFRMVFQKTREPGKWTWTADLTGEESIRGGGTGTIRLGSDGSLEAFEFDGGATTFSFDPNNGSNPVDILLSVGSEGEFDGITQLAAASTVAVTRQDGYSLGQLESIAIDERGFISGNFNNGIRRTIAQIALAQFNNPSGLNKIRDSLFVESINSGSAIFGEAGTTIQGRISSSALEQSNVDLAEEFTRLITAQRGFQANSRVITTSNDVLNELVNLKQ